MRGWKQLIENAQTVKTADEIQLKQVIEVRNKMRRALVSLSDGVWQVIDEDLKGKLGDGDSEVIRNLVVGYLIEKGYLLSQKAGGGNPIERIAGGTGHA